MRYLFLISLLLVLNKASHAQYETKAITKAEKCFDKKLKKSGESFQFLTASIDSIVKVPNEDAFAQYVDNYFDILDKSGLANKQGVDYSTVCDCLFSKYDLNGNKTDTLSGYYAIAKKYDHFKNQDVNFNPDLMMKFIVDVMSKSKDEEFSKGALSFLMFDMLIKIKKDDENSVKEKDDIEVFMAPPPSQAKPTKEAQKEHRIYDVVENEPKFPGGKEALEEYFKFENVTEEAKVYVQFIVTDKGDVIEPRILRGHADYNDQVLKQVVKMPKWEPGKQRGEAVFVRYTMPVEIKK